MSGFTFGLSGLVLCRRRQAVGVGFFRVVLASLAGLQSAILVIPLGSVACCSSRALSAWRVWFLSRYAAMRQCGNAVWRVVRVRGKMSFILCPTSQSKGLPAIPAGEVGFFHR